MLCFQAKNTEFDEEKQDMGRRRFRLPSRYENHDDIRGRENVLVFQLNLNRITDH